MTNLVSKLDLTSQHCQSYDKNSLALTNNEIQNLLPLIPLWNCESNTITRNFKHANYHETIAFVNVIADIVHVEDHHPDLIVKYNTCKVNFTTHSVNGLSKNDFICAAKIDAQVN